MTTACDFRRNLIASMIVFLVVMLVHFPILYNEVWSFKMILLKFLGAFFCFTILTVLSMLITYIAQIRSKMSQLMAENLNLLNRMHEGLVIVSENDLKLTFASKPAIELLKPDNDP